MVPWLQNKGIESERQVWKKNGKSVAQYDKQVKIYSELQKSGAQEKERFEASMWSFESRLK